MSVVVGRSDRGRSEISGGNHAVLDTRFSE